MADENVRQARYPVTREAAQLLKAELQSWSAQLQGRSLPANPLPGALAKRFYRITRPYGEASSARQRVQVLRDHFPKSLLPPSDFPGQPGYRPEYAQQSIRNLLSWGTKAGTDAYKSDMGALVFSQVASRLQKTLAATPGRLTITPYDKQGAVAAGKFDWVRAQEALRPNPSLAASVMEAAMQTLYSHGLQVPAQPGPTDEQIGHAAGRIAEQAAQAEHRVTPLMQSFARIIGATLQAQRKLRSRRSIGDQLRLHTTIRASTHRRCR
ncbi:MAG TPA: hypothetical protein VFP68_11225 [Burkholderiaceae bacterium]|nr:hypothetical protein [Burkholderiaceae bacterium]